MPTISRPSRSASTGSGQPDLSEETWKRLEGILEDFEIAWQRGERPNLDDFLARAEDESQRRALLVELAFEDLEFRWKAGESVGSEAYLDRYPPLRENASAAVELIVFEFRLRQRQGECSPTDFVARFPDYREQLLARLERPDLPDRGMQRPDESPSTAQPGAIHPVLRPGVDLPPPPVPGFEILEVIGRGGMGVVYRARQVALDRIVALKMILTGAHAGEEERARFLAEAKAVAEVRHPGIVGVHEFGTHDGTAYFALEYCEGGSLARSMSGRPLPPREAARLVEQIARAVQAAHEQGIIHRDLKPGNVLLDGNGQPRVADFGVARRVEGGLGLTRTGAIMGTPPYMPPEQARGQKDVGPTADVYSLGAILYECLTGRPPFLAATSMETLHQVMTQEPVSPRRLNAKTPKDLETICTKCLQKDARKRYPSAEALAADLKRFLDGEPILGRPVGPTERCVRWARRRPTAAALVAVGALIALAAVAAVPLLAAVLQATRNQVVEEQKRTGRAKTRAKCQQLRSEARDALARTPPDPGAAEVLYGQIAAAIREEDARLDEDLRQLQDEANQERAKLAARQKALQNYQQLLERRNEAVFQLNRDVVAGMDTANPKESEKAAREGLALFGVSVDSAAPTLDDLDPKEKKEAAEALYEVLLVLADAMSRSASEEEAERRERTTAALAVLERAERFARETLAAEPSPALHHRRASLLDSLGEKDRAARERQAAQKPPVNALDWFFRGYDHWVAASDARAVAAAIADFDQALKRQPGLFWARFFQAVGYSRLHQRARAMVALTVCIRERPSFVWLYVLRGYYYGQEGNYAAAEEDLQTAEQMQKGQGGDELIPYVVLVNRGVLALQKKEKKQIAVAIDHFEKAVKIEPDRYHAHLDLAEAYQRSKNLPRAIEEMNEAIRCEPKLPNLYRTRARLHLQNKDSASALADFRSAIEFAEKDLALRAGDHVECGLILYETDKVKAAEEATAALKISPGFAPAHLLLAAVLLQDNRPDRALIEFDRYFAAENGQPRIEAYKWRAVARAKLGDYEGVIDDCNGAIAVKPDGQLHLTRGLAFLALGAAKLAFRDFDEAVVRYQIGEEAYAGRGFARVKLGEWRKGVEDVRQIDKIKRPSANACYYAALALAQASAVPSGPTPQQRQAYKDESVRYLTRTLGLLPESERTTFWRDKVRQNGEWQPLLSHPQFARLAEKYSGRK